MILFIDTTDLQNVHFALISEKVFEYTAKLEYHESHKTLEHLKKFLKKNKIDLPLQPKTYNLKPQLAKLVVCSGPGSFTGTRIGVTIAQALSFALDVPAVGIKKAQIPKDLRSLPSYQNGQKITAIYNRPAINQTTVAR